MLPKRWLGCLLGVLLLVRPTAPDLRAWFFPSVELEWRLALGRRVLAALEGRVPPPRPQVPPWPVTSARGWRHDPFHGGLAFHSGVDLAMPRGTPVVAPADALVLHAGWRGGYGRTVTLALGARCVVLLAHLDRLDVEAGQVVPAGWPLGLSGDSGRATGPHLHFEHRCPRGGHAR